MLCEIEKKLFALNVYSKPGSIITTLKMLVDYSKVAFILISKTTVILPIFLLFSVRMEID